MPDRPHLSIDDLRRFRVPADPAISPDGRFGLFVLQTADMAENGYARQLWRVALDSGELRQLTRGEGACSNPRWSPDGRFILFCANRAEKKQTELWLLPADGGEAWPLTSLAGTVTDPVWSPDGRAMLFGYRARDAEPEGEQAREQQPDYRRVSRLSYKLDGDGFLPAARWQVMRLRLDASGEPDGEPLSLTEGPYDHSGARFSPDGERVVLAANRSEPLDLDIERSDLWLVPAAGGPLERLTGCRGPFVMPGFASDGEAVYCCGHQGPPGHSMIESYHLWRVPLSGGEPVDLTPTLDRSLGNLTIGDVRDAAFYGPPPLVAPDGASVLFVISDAGAARLWQLGLEDGRLSELTPELADVYGSALSPDGRRLLLVASGTEDAGELYLLEREGEGWGPPRRLTTLNPWLAERRLLPVESFEVPGDPPVQAWRVAPPGEGPHPTVLQIHGGPHTQYGWVMMHEFQVMAAQGHQVVYANPRGSQGYGKAFAGAIHGDWGGPAHADLMRVVDEAVSRGWADPARLGICGGSYGGYMTLWSIGHDDRFRAACAQRLVSNMESMFGTSDLGWFFALTVGGKPPWEDRQAYVRASPISYIDRVETPLLIIHSEQDHRCPMEQAEQVFTALRYRGREVELVRFVGESHGLSRGGRPQNRLERLRRITGWFAERL